MGRASLKCSESCIALSSVRMLCPSSPPLAIDTSGPSPPPARIGSTTVCMFVRMSAQLKTQSQARARSLTQVSRASTGCSKAACSNQSAISMCTDVELLPETVLSSTLYTT